MKKMIILLFFVFLLLAAAPAAAETKETVGERINLVDQTPTQLVADTPFHIYHGWWVWAPVDTPIGRYDFQLDINGVIQKEDFVYRYVDSSDKPESLYRDWVFNFPDGLPEGTYTFTGHWFAPCRVVQEYGYPVTCPTPNDKLEVITESLTVTFITP